MTSFTIEIKPPADLLDAMRELTRAYDRMAAALEAQQQQRHVRVLAADHDGQIPADLAEIAAWAKPRGLVFASWDDLPLINSYCDSRLLPTFKRRSGRAKAA